MDAITTIIIAVLTVTNKAFLKSDRSEEFDIDDGWEFIRGLTVIRQKLVRQNVR